MVIVVIQYGGNTLLLQEGLQVVADDGLVDRWFCAHDLSPRL
jgi:hypothetical protein